MSEPSSSPLPQPKPPTAHPAERVLFPTLLLPMEHLGQQVLEQLDALGRFIRFCGQTLLWTFRRTAPPPPSPQPAQANLKKIARQKKPSGGGLMAGMLPQLYFIGTLSIPVVAIVGAFVGMVLAIEVFDQFNAIGQAARMGGVIGLSVVRQIGPVLTAVMIAGRVGGAVSAELGTMNVTEQLDAMRVMGTEPIRYLVVPRVLACVIMVPALTLISNNLGVLGGYLVTVRGYGVNETDYWLFTAQFVESYDIFSGLFKASFFGLAIGLIACYKGFTCKSGAEGVGRAATDAFVTSFVVIIVVNLVLAYFLKHLHDLLIGPGGVNAFS